LKVLITKELMIHSPLMMVNKTMMTIKKMGKVRIKVVEYKRDGVKDIKIHRLMEELPQMKRT
jgi:hypothetical protein